MAEKEAAVKETVEAIEKEARKRRESARSNHPAYFGCLRIPTKPHAKSAESEHFIGKNFYFLAVLCGLTIRIRFSDFGVLWTDLCLRTYFWC